MALYQWGPNQVQLFQRQPDSSLVRVPGDGFNADYLAWAAVPGNVADLDADDATLRELAPVYQSMLNQIAADQAKLVDAAWTPLTTAAKAETLRAIEQDLLTGFARLLKALAVLVRRGGGA